MFKYFGIDWILLTTLIISMIMIAYKNKNGFIVGFISAIFGVIFGLMVGSFPNILGSTIIAVINIISYFKWTK